MVVMLFYIIAVDDTEYLNTNITERYPSLGLWGGLFLTGNEVIFSKNEYSNEDSHIIRWLACLYNGPGVRSSLSAKLC